MVWGMVGLQQSSDAVLRSLLAPAPLYRQALSSARASASAIDGGERSTSRYGAGHQPAGLKKLNLAIVFGGARPRRRPPLLCKRSSLTHQNPEVVEGRARASRSSATHQAHHAQSLLAKSRARCPSGMRPRPPLRPPLINKPSSRLGDCRCVSVTERRRCGMAQHRNQLRPCQEWWGLFFRTVLDARPTLGVILRPGWLCRQ